MKNLKRFISLLLVLSVVLSVTALPTGAITLPLKGDVDGSDELTVADILLIKNIIMGQACSTRVKYAADLDAGGKVDVGDIMLLKNLIMADFSGETLEPAEIADGETFYIQNIGANQLIMEGGDGWAHLGTLTGTVAQQWRAVKKGDYYMIVSEMNGKAWTIRVGFVPALAMKICPDPENPEDDFLFAFEPTGDGAYKIKSKNPERQGGVLETPNNSVSEDCMILLWGQDDSPTENWLLYPAEKDERNDHLNEDFADLAFDCFNDAYYFDRGASASIMNTNGFWDVAEMMEMYVDTYERSGDEKHLEMVNKLYNGFVERHGTDWTGNEFNDDIMWMVLFCVRAYNATGDKKYKEQAIFHFEKVYDRGYDAQFGGGIYWKKGGTGKNACINFPAALAATYLYDLTGERDYLNKAERLFSWAAGVMFDEETGAVYDNVHYDENRSIVLDKSVWTYNQGTFIGAATRLYEITGKKAYIEMAKKAADHTIFTMFNNDVNGLEGDNNNYQDFLGFKGIFFRWFGYYIHSQNVTDYDEWIELNLRVGWHNRTSRCLVNGRWDGKAPESLTRPFSYYNYVVLAQIAPYERLRELNK